MKWEEWTDGPIPEVSPCCNAKIASGLGQYRIFGVCKECGQIVAESNKEFSKVRVKVAE